MFGRIVHRFEESVLCLLLVSMTLLVFSETMLRFFFNTGLLWAEEATLYLGAWMVLFGASYGVRVNAHIGVDAFVKLLPSGPRRAVAALTVVMCLVYCGLFLYGGWIYLAKMYKIGIELSDIPVPRWVAQSILFIGFILLAIRFLQLLWGIITGKSNGFEFVDEAKESMHLADETADSSSPAQGNRS
ncbi:TRAP transporter small permease subunit [Hahella sp. KA22]|uniref:TRAP transporter small permease n=1 Tax=unclassified Hahella TaxID=2624107 RepID=UPI000FDEDF7D|nr:MULTISPECIES: TRAP transporter small permease [unclassified Hahella]AZZ95002.1 TRAP transporter small permease [Hahella sp. KA22]MBU6951147.1 TRAP transporter small permease [Hahella sp. HN01]QAY52647.1 TRAP transporter small permease subunit [Hahella sp. KA22]